jgi:acyl dehydratase
MQAHGIEHLEEGREYVTGSRRITGEDILAFAALSGDHNPLHLGDRDGEEGEFGGRIAHGVLGVAVATGLLSQLGLTRGSLVALLGVRWDFRAPVRPGDELRARVRVLETRLTRRGDRGVVRLRMRLLNQREELVQEGELTELVRCRSAVARDRAEPAAPAPP